jgi:hypothetical protein
MLTEPFDNAPEVDEKRDVLPPPQARELGTFKLDEFGDPTELLIKRYLCRGGGLLLVGPTGVGKSAFVLQCALLWSLGKPLFGIQPTKALRILIIQAENDEGDIAEMRNGVMTALNPSAEDSQKACKNILIATENARTSDKFCQDVVRPLLSEHRPDLLIIDPALAYLGGETNNQKDVGTFLRNGLNPLLAKFQCGCIVVHHTNKPPQGNEKPKWQAGDFAYLGSGSAEWANWARAVLAIRNVGSNVVYELRAGKRASRLGWKDTDGNPVYAKYIAHAKEPGQIHWRDPEASELPCGVEGGLSEESAVLSLIPESGAVPKKSVLRECRKLDIGQNRARDILDTLILKRLLFEHPKKRHGNRAEIYLSRSSEEPKFDPPPNPDGSVNSTNEVLK